MAKKHKTKQTEHDQQKLATAHRRYEYLYKMHNLINVLTGDPTVFMMLDKRTQHTLYSLRIKALRIEAAIGHDVDPRVHSFIKAVLLTYMRNVTVPFTRNGP